MPRVTPKNKKVKPKKKKNNALVMCHDGGSYWTNQKQFWQWIRDGIIIKIGDYPLSGKFVRRDEEKTVVLANTVLNLAHRNHLREALAQRKLSSRK